MITRENYEIWMLDFAEGKLNPAQQKLLFEFLDKNPDLKKQVEGVMSVSFDKPLINDTPSLNLKKKKSWLLEKYSEEELIFHVSENNLNQEELREWNDLVNAMPQLIDKVLKEKQFVLKPKQEEKFDEKFLLKKQVDYIVTTENYQHYFLLFADTKELALHKAIAGFLQAHPQYEAEFKLTQQLVLKPDASVVFEDKQSLKKKERVIAFYMWRAVAAAACIVLAVFFFNPAGNTPDQSIAQTSDSLNGKAPVGIEKENKADNHAVNNVPNGVNNVAVNNGTNRRVNDIKQDRKNQLVKDTKSPENNIAKQEEKQINPLKNTREKDSVKQVFPPVNEPHKDEMALNKTEPAKELQGTNNAFEFVAKVINNKYYEEETPKGKEASTFYAMKNVVNSASGGKADISKKEDSEYKEFGFKIGDFKFSRKKNKNKVEE